MRELVTMMTSSADGHSSLIMRYTILLNPISFAWNNLVTAKNTSVASTCWYNNQRQFLFISIHYVVGRCPRHHTWEFLYLGQALSLVD
mmetsp:Transcript_7706/g.47702  ORF Transcript_7706/g.47702 Transcript_7706/m.47702 type:complete len:88 (+) Transcript_7706:2787-3050(+)